MNKVLKVVECYETGIGVETYKGKVALRGRDCAACEDTNLCLEVCRLLRDYKGKTFWEKFIALCKREEEK